MISRLFAPLLVLAGVFNAHAAIITSFNEDLNGDPLFPHWFSKCYGGEKLLSEPGGGQLY